MDDSLPKKKNGLSQRASMKYKGFMSAALTLDLPFGQKVNSHDKHWRLWQTEIKMESRSRRIIRSYI